MYTFRIIRFPVCVFSLGSILSWGNKQQLPPGDRSLILSADIGGTNSRFKLISVSPTDPVERKQRAPGTVVYENKYPNANFASFNDVVDKFLVDAQGATQETKPIQPEAACLAVAGVVTENRCRLTNLDWHIDGHELEKRHNIGRLELVNDFVAQGYGILTLGDHEVKCLTDAKPREGAPIACLGAGTGLGECFLTMGEGGYVCYPSEGGHAEWAPRGRGSEETQIDLLRYLKIKYSEQNRISVERVVSGPGISNIYDFLAYKYPEKTDKEVHKAFLARRREAAAVVQHAQPGSLCEQALSIFSSCYGAEAGVTALKFLPFGGLYLTGGVTGKTMDFLMKDHVFMDAFHDKGRVSPVLQRVPLYVVLTEDMGERGSHLRAVRLLNELRGEKAKKHQEENNTALELVPPRGLSYHDYDK